MPDEKPTETVEEKLARLERENTELRARNDAFDKSLKVLAEREPPPPPAAAPVPMGPGDEAFRAHLRSRGYSDEQINANLSVLNDFLPWAARPFVQGLGTLADRADYHDWRITDPESAELDEDVRRERQQLLATGQVKPYSDVAAVVKAKRRPKKEDVEADFNRRVEDEVQRRLRGGGGGVVETGRVSGTQHAGPGPTGAATGGGDRPLSRDEFEALPHAKKIEYLERTGYAQ